MAPSPSPSSLRPRRVSSSHQNPSGLSCSPTCKHSPSATLDLLILILVLFSCTFLISSSLSYLFRSLSLLLPSLSLSLSLSIPAAAPLLALLAVAVAVAVLLLALSLAAALPWSRRRCSNPRCKGLKKALEFDVQLQTEEAIRASPQDAAWRAIDELPWKGGQGGNNPDYERLRAELRRMAPPNGRAVLLFRLRCGCPVSKLEAWGPKRGRKPKKGTAKLALEGVNR